MRKPDPSVVNKTPRGEFTLKKLPGKQIVVRERRGHAVPIDFATPIIPLAGNVWIERADKCAVLVDRRSDVARRAHDSRFVALRRSGVLKRRRGRGRMASA